MAYINQPLPPASSPESEGEHRNCERSLDTLADVSLQITAELGRIEVTIRHLLALKPGSILTVSDTPSCEVTLQANGNQIAKGEVVVVNDRFGVRVTEVK
jgi:flagellar motor switch protein FliN/FliY